MAITTTWEVGKPILDTHGILIPAPPGEYTLIVGLYDLNNPTTRLSAGTEDHVTLGKITVAY
jgi:hypothetical protein